MPLNQEIKVQKQLIPSFGNLNTIDIVRRIFTKH